MSQSTFAAAVAQAIDDTKDAECADFDEGRVEFGTQLAEALYAEVGANSSIAGLDSNGRLAQNVHADKMTVGVLDEARVPFESPGPIGGTVAGTGRFATVDITSSAPGSPTANRLYKENIPKAWLSYDGGTQSIDDDFNISSVTYNGTGHYTVNFATDFAAGGRYAAVFCGNSGLDFVVAYWANDQAGSCKVRVEDDTGSRIDTDVMGMMIGDQ